VPLDLARTPQPRHQRRRRKGGPAAREACSADCRLREYPNPESHVPGLEKVARWHQFRDAKLRGWRSLAVCRRWAATRAEELSRAAIRKAAKRQDERPKAAKCRGETHSGEKRWDETRSGGKHWGEIRLAWLAAGWAATWPGFVPSTAERIHRRHGSRPRENRRLVLRAPAGRFHWRYSVPAFQPQQQSTVSLDCPRVEDGQM
jgi:hypothetical protein